MELLGLLLAVFVGQAHCLLPTISASDNADIQTGARTMPHLGKESVGKETDRVVYQEEPVELKCILTLPSRSGTQEKADNKTVPESGIYWTKRVADKFMRIRENSTQLKTNITYEIEQVSSVLTVLPPKRMKKNALVEWVEWDSQEQTAEVSMAALAGEYQCVFRPQAYAEMSKNVNVTMAPIVAEMETVIVQSGEPAQLICRVFGHPRPDSYSWSNEAGKTVSRTQSFNISTTKYEERGLYVCEVEATIREKNYMAIGKVFLRVKDALALLWPCIGIIVEIAVIAIIVVCSERQRRADKAARDDSAEATPLKSD